ncbi:hypothetical protein Z043_120716 [Scleropages formosus]|uniref:Uncharacterized protein n=1 Tax=Scleropages formosus TaxID=113540 RepID=A0A0P7UNJ7_SCLFO|nr:hypothetical protein Z043_120716 [Scleropages formosus]
MPGKAARARAAAREPPPDAVLRLSSWGPAVSDADSRPLPHPLRRSSEEPPSLSPGCPQARLPRSPCPATPGGSPSRRHPRVLVRKPGKREKLDRWR